MKKIIRKIVRLFIICFFAGLSCTAQKTNDKEVDVTSYTSQILKLSAPETKYQPAIPIAEILVYDVRFDTVSSGFVEHATYKKEKLIHFSKPASIAVKEYFQSKINFSENNSTSYTLVCIIKKLLLSDNIYIDNNKQVSSSDVSYEIRSGVMAFFEFYVKSGNNYSPLYRFDTTITGTKSIYQNCNQYIKNVLEASLQKLKTVNPEKIKTFTKPKSLEEINSYNNSRFNIAVLNEKPRKGVYPNFESFRNNAPLDTPYTIDKSSKGDFLYVKNQKGEDMLQTDFWGYCDGTNMYVFSAENYFKLYRYGNTFLIYGAKGFTSTRKLRLNFGLLDVAMPNSSYAKSKTANSYNLELKLHQLDMDSGELY